MLCFVLKGSAEEREFIAERKSARPALVVSMRGYKGVLSMRSEGNGLARSAKKEDIGSRRAK